MKEGAIWCNGKAGEVIRYRRTVPNTNADLERPNPDAAVGKVQFFFEDTDGALWACYKDYLFKWQPIKQSFQYIRSLPKEILYAFKRSDGSMMMAIQHRETLATNKNLFSLIILVAYGTLKRIKNDDEKLQIKVALTRELFARGGAWRNKRSCLGGAGHLPPKISISDKNIKTPIQNAGALMPPSTSVMIDSILPPIR